MPPRCSSCSGEYMPIPGDGNTPCPVMCIGERPGDMDNKRHQVSVGKPGMELDATYLPLAHLRRSGVYVSNVVKCWAKNSRAPSLDEIRSCSQCFLPAELAAVQPEFLILLGSSACRITDEPIRLEMHHGRPRWGSVLGGAWEGWIWPSYHPAAGLHDGKNMTWLLEDWRNLGEWLQGEWEAPEPEEGAGVVKDYRLAKTHQDLENYLWLQQPNWPNGGIFPMACDTETHGASKFSIQISHTPHTGRMILAEDKELAGWFKWWAGRSNRYEHGKHFIQSSPNWIFHYAAHDMDELARYGIEIPNGRWQDTMQAAYHTANLPQGLKPLAYRLLGVTMTSWEDTVWPASINALDNWMSSAMALADYDTSMQERIVTNLKRGRCVECGHQHTKGACKKCGCECREVTLQKVEWKIGKLAGVLKHIHRYMTAPDQDLDTPYQPWKKLAEMRETGLRGKVPEKWEWEAVEEQVGEMPILGIGNCELGQAVDYGCGDADYTLQVAGKLQGRLKEESQVGRRLYVDEEDWDL